MDQTQWIEVSVLEKEGVLHTAVGEHVFSFFFYSVFPFLFPFPMGCADFGASDCVRGLFLFAKGRS